MKSSSALQRCQGCFSKTTVGLDRWMGNPLAARETGCLTRPGSYSTEGKGLFLLGHGQTM